MEMLLNTNPSLILNHPSCSVLIRLQGFPCTAKNKDFLFFFLLSQLSKITHHYYLLICYLFFDHFLRGYYPECLRMTSMASLTNLGQIPICTSLLRC